jgi:hypothetical protein
VTKAVELLSLPTITHISADPKLRVDESAWLWRYVKLSTLFLNLSGTVYVPTVAQLQKSDPKEGLAAVSAEWRFGYLFDDEPDTIKKIIEALPLEKQKLIGAGVHKSRKKQSAYYAPGDYRMKKLNRCYE